jgi:hypothetical protein
MRIRVTKYVACFGGNSQEYFNLTYTNVDATYKPYSAGSTEAWSWWNGYVESDAKRPTVPGQNS